MRSLWFWKTMVPPGLSKPSKNSAGSRNERMSDLLLDPENGGRTFFQNGGLLLD
jgi:hypothetical protein